MNIVKKYLELEPSANVEMLERYVDFCRKNDGKCVRGEYVERHHILLQSLFPEHKTDTNNIVTLTLNKHKESHKLLYNAIPNVRAIFYSHFLLNDIDEVMRIKNVEWLTGDTNPAKRDGVRAKISNSKTGVSRPDMLGKKYFGASSDKVEGVKRRSSETHKGMVPVRLPDGEVIKVRTDDKRYISGELKCIIGNIEGGVGPTSKPKALSKYKNSMQKRRDKFKGMSGYDIASHCLDMQEDGAKLVKKSGNLNSNAVRLFNYAELDWKRFLVISGNKVQRLSKASG